MVMRLIRMMTKVVKIN